ncbi:MAG: hypothetical protein ACFFCO_09655 [Promethearchaeota archaeon]
MANLQKVHSQLEDLVEVLEHTARSLDQLSLTSKGPILLEIGDSLEGTIREIKEIVSYQLNQFAGASRDVTPRREALQIISGLSLDILDELSSLRQHIQRFQSQSQLKKGLIQILDISSEIDYVTDSVKILLRLARRMLSQMTRLEVLTD